MGTILPPAEKTLPGEVDDISLNDPEKQIPQPHQEWKRKLAQARKYFWPAEQQEGSTTTGRLAYLDGLRGFAALTVFQIHHQGWTHDFMGNLQLENAFGWNGSYKFASLPGIRLMFSGGLFAVSIFFIMSGYVLAYSPLRSINTKDHMKFANLLNSAIFRRWFRLYLPVAATSLIWVCSWHVFKIRSSQDGHIPYPTIREEVAKWYNDMKNFSFIWHSSLWLGSNDHAWSIAYEYRGSIVVYTTLMAFQRVTSNFRLLGYSILIWYFLYVVEGWYCALFIMGMLLCDLDMIADRDELPRILNVFAPLKIQLSWLILAIGMYLGGVPGTGETLENIQMNPGWYYLSLLTPSVFTDPRRFFHFLGASLIVAAVPRISQIKRFFETRVCQFLGRVSFGFYLIHGPVLWSIGDRLYAATGRPGIMNKEVIPNWVNWCPLPSFGPLGLEFNYLIPNVTLLLITLWLAELVTKYIDEPSVKLAQWMFKYTLADEDYGRKRAGERLI